MLPSRFNSQIGAQAGAQALLSGLSILVLVIGQVFALTSCKKEVAEEKHTVATALDVKVTQPDLIHLLAVTNKITLQASGKFASGSFWVGHNQITFLPGTEFKVNMVLPIDNANTISTKHATGALWTSQQISVNALPVPQSIVLVEGKASGEVELGRWLASFFVNLLQLGNNDGGLRNTVDSMSVQSCQLELRPGLPLKFGQKTLQVAKGSTITLSNLTIDHNLDYHGDMLFDLKLDKGCQWLGKKVDCLFEGGNAQLPMLVRRQGPSIKLSLNHAKSSAPPINLEQCRFSFGVDKSSRSNSKLCQLAVEEIIWERLSGTQDPELRFKSKMLFTDSTADIKTATHETILALPDKVDAHLDVDTRQSVRETHFATTSDAHAKSIEVHFNKKNSNLVLKLEEGTIGPANFDKFGAMNFSLNKGAARFNSVEWSSGTSNFSLHGNGASFLSVPSEMLLEKSKPGARTSMLLPIDIEVGQATLKTGEETIGLENLRGKLNFDVDKEIQMNSDLDFTIKRSSFFSDTPADVKVRGIDLNIKDGKGALSMRQCHLDIPNEALAQAIDRETPRNFSLDLNKTLVEDKHWRYRNATVTKVEVEGLQIGKMSSDRVGTLNFEAAANVDMYGTVEKCGLIIGKDKWEEKPWSLKAKLKGPGSVDYKFIHGDQTSVKYDLSMQLPLPKDMELDWSQVGAGILRATEKQVILSHLRSIKVPVKHQGELKLFQDDKWKNIKVDKLVIKPTATGSLIEFSANVNL